MDEQGYRRCQVLIAMAMGSAVGLSVAWGKCIAAGIAIVVGLGVLHLCRSRAMEILEDERVRGITGKAATSTLRIGLLAVGVSGVFMLALSNAGYLELMNVGLTLCLTVSFLVLLWVGLYSYYSGAAKVL